MTGVTHRMEQAALYALVQKVWGEVLDVPCDPSQTWEEAGADSLCTLHLLLGLERALGCKLSYDSLEPQMTAAEVAQSIGLTLLADSAAAARVEEAAPTIFLFTGIFGDEPMLAAFRRSFGGRVRFHTIEPPGLENPNAVLNDMPSTAALGVAEIQRAAPDGELLLAGYSFGGAAAYEAAQALVAAGRCVAWIGIFDAPVETKLPDSADEPRDLVHHTLHALGATRLGRRAVMSAIRTIRPLWLSRAERSLAWSFRLSALSSWRPQPLQVPALLVVSEHFGARHVDRWTELCTGLQVVHLPAMHHELLQAASLAVLTPMIEAAVLARPCNTSSPTELDAALAP